MKLKNTMTKPATKIRHLSCAAALLCGSGLLVGCGESDLTQIQLDAIAEAQRKAALAPLTPTPAEEGAGPEAGDMVDEGSSPSVTGSEVDTLLADATLVFSDEFNGNSIDPVKWNTAYVWGPGIVVNDEKQYYPDTQTDASLGIDPFVFNGQTLSITAVTTPANSLSDTNDQPYVSGVITTNGNYDFTYGYAEIRAKLPAGQGFWPGFWMLGTDFEDLKPQLYVMEGRGNITDTVYHRYNYSNANDEFSYSDLLPSTVDTGSDFSSDFHTFGVDWSEGDISFYVDGTKTHSITHSNVSRQNMYLILNLAVGGWFPGAPDNTTVLPAAFEIDYVRIYQKN